MASKPLIFFAPGAWHSPASFRLVRDALHERGWETDAVEYPSVGAEPPNKALTDDVVVVRANLESLVEQGKHLLVVAHSYGGLVCGEAIRELGSKERAKQGKSGGVIVLLYLSAFVLHRGQTIFDLLGGSWLPWFRVEGDYVYAETPEQIFYHDVPEELQKEAIANLAHQSRRVYLDKAEYEPWHNIPCLFFVCEDDKAIPAPAQEKMAAILGPNSIIHRSKSSHSPFLSAVDDMVEGLEKAALSCQSTLD